MIHVSNLTKSYGDYPAIQDVSFDVPDLLSRLGRGVTEPLLEAMDGIGNFVGFLGPNGAGKSTTMCILADSQAATSGSAVISGQDVFWKPVEARRSIGYMPENCSLYPEMRDPSFTFIARVNPASGY